MHAYHEPEALAEIFNCSFYSLNLLISDAIDRPEPKAHVLCGIETLTRSSTDAVRIKDVDTSSAVGLS